MQHYYLNNQITKLWNKFNLIFDDYHLEIMKRVPSYLSAPETKDKILFIGLNPAFQREKKLMKNSLIIPLILILKMKK